MRIYFSGIGGAGIGPLAEIALDAGYKVVGSDLNKSLFTNNLEKRGVKIYFQQNGEDIKTEHSKKPIDWFVYTSALPENHPELVFARANNIKVSKRDEFLADFIEQHNLKLIAVAGTHGKTTTTGMLIWLFNKLQIGSFGEDNINISEMVKSMYGQGYDFRHFCTMSIPVMITEVIVRVSYFIKRLSEGYSFKEAIPFGLSHEKKPKLSSMLFIAHSAATAINAGKVILTENPLNINYPQWLMFAKYSLIQLKWMFMEKPELRHKYVMEIINNEWDVLSADIENLWQDISKNAVVYMD